MAEPIGHRIPVAPTGGYATIGVAAQRPTPAALGGAEPGWRAQTVLDAPDTFSPPVRYAPATALFDDGRREEGAFGFYAAQLRTRFDVNRRADVTAHGAAEILTGQHGPPINRWVSTDPERLRGLAAVLEDRPGR